MTTTTTATATATTTIRGVVFYVISPMAESARGVAQRQAAQIFTIAYIGHKTHINTHGVCVSQTSTVIDVRRLKKPFAD